MKQDGLFHVHYCQNNGAVLMRVGTGCFIDGSAVIQLACDKITDWLRVIGYDGKELI